MLDFRRHCRQRMLSNAINYQQRGAESVYLLTRQMSSAFYERRVVWKKSTWRGSQRVNLLITKCDCVHIRLITSCIVAVYILANQKRGDPKFKGELKEVVSSYRIFYNILCECISQFHWYVPFHLYSLSLQCQITFAGFYKSEASYTSKVKSLSM